MATLRKLLYFGICLTVTANAEAQFTSGLLTNESYWSDGKAEFDYYDAQLMRGGQSRQCELILIIARETLDGKTLAHVADAKSAVAAVRMQQIWSAPLGMFAEQGSLTAYWMSARNSLLKLSFVGTNSFGNIENHLEKTEEFYELGCDNYRDGRTKIALPPPPNGFWYDELPLRVRTIDFSKPPTEFEVFLAPSLTSFSRGETVPFRPAKVSWKPVNGSIEVVVQHKAGFDLFRLDRDFPFLLREWRMIDGSTLKLKRGLKADYWQYGRNGDRERALKNPMLQHPD